MKEYRTYRVTFRWYDTDTFCTNLAKGTEADIRKHYENKGHEIIAMATATMGDELEAEAKGMPIIRL